MPLSPWCLANFQADIADIEFRLSPLIYFTKIVFLIFCLKSVSIIGLFFCRENRFAEWENFSCKTETFGKDKTISEKLLARSSCEEELAKENLLQSSGGSAYCGRVAASSCNCFKLKPFRKYNEMQAIFGKFPKRNEQDVCVRQWIRQNPLRRGHRSEAFKRIISLGCLIAFRDALWARSFHLACEIDLNKFKFRMCLKNA